MPIVPSSYHAPLVYQADLSTIYYGALKKESPLAYRRESFDTPDGDFIDLDWYNECGNTEADKNERDNKRPIVIIIHGFEGSSQSRGVIRFAKYFAQKNWAIVGMNLKGCSGRNNRMISSYHSGAGYQIGWVVEHLCSAFPNRELYLIGLSLGGNILLNYLGEASSQPGVVATAAISVPCDLQASEEKIWSHLWHLYTYDFLRSVKAKAREKDKLFPGVLNMSAIERSKRLRDFDDCCTAPINGFAGVEDYYRQASSKQRIPAITTPTLLITAQDDPFLCQSCIPFDEASGSNTFFLEAPLTGGHLAFPSSMSWLQNRVFDFLTNRAI